ncbi:MAG TPA: hypothetical protein VK745_03450 [Polyangiaceae bacterium]|nr:hypothetical protein [Polyangiaceae bacterium]
MARSRLCWPLLFGLLAIGCGPDHPDCTGPHADFQVLLELRDGPLAPDTVVHVTYGGSGMEDFSLMNPNADHEVVFCRPASLDGGVVPDGSQGAAGATGADDSEVDALYCELWTGGFASLEVHATGLTLMTYNLSPREHVCTVAETIVLDSPDGG